MCRKEHVLRRRVAAEESLQLGQGFRVADLPLGEVPERRADGAEPRGLPARRDQELRRVKELRGAEAAEALAQLLVAVELVDGLVQPLVAESRVLALDDGERDPVHVDHDVRDDVLLLALDLELPRDDQVVPRSAFEVEEADRVALLAVAAVLLDRDAEGEGGVRLLVRLQE
jgi:hypothetical protein